MEIQGYKIHPLAQKIPEMTPNEYRQFKESIQRDGQTMPVIRHQGVVLDGRNRLKACLELGIEPKIEEYIGTISVAQFILSTNIRRNLSKLQREQMIADFAAIIYPEIKAEMTESKKSKPGRRSLVPTDPSARNSGMEPRGKRDARLAFAQQTGASFVEAKQAKAILEHAPDMLGDVAKLGGLSKTAKEAIKQSAAKPKGAKAKAKTEPSAKELQKRREAILDATRKPWLSKEEVDPDFKGTSQEFVDKYGHVHILTKKQREDDADKVAFSSWVAAFRKLKKPLAEYLEIGKFKVENYHKFIAKAPDKERRIGEMRELADLVSRTSESINWLIEELTK